MLIQINQKKGTKCAKCGKIDNSITYQGDSNYWCSECFANYYMKRGIEGRKLLKIVNAAGSIIHGGMDNI